MMTVLALNAAFRPTDWLTVEEAAKYYAENHILSELGDTALILNGGTRRDGLRSRLSVSSIIAVAGQVVPWHAHIFRLPKRGNRMLFQRDRYMCAYCGDTFPPTQLEREHVTPRAHHGRDVWENVVSACTHCNGRKRDRTPEQAGMPLHYLPYAPSPYEHMILRGRNVLSDQMSFLLQNVPKSSRLLS